MAGPNSRKLKRQKRQGANKNTQTGEQKKDKIK